MKKLLLLFGCFISVLTAAQEIDKPYDFPVKPGTKQWAELTTSKQMDEVCVIPDYLLDAISTKALLITCLNYPRILDFFLFDNMQSGFNICSNRFNGLTELLNRSDLSQILLKFYMDFDFQKNTIVGYNGNLSRLQIGFLELLIAQEKVINILSEKDKNTLLVRATKNLEKRKEIGESIYRQKTNALIVSRILASKNILPNELDIYGNNIFDVFNSSVIILDTTFLINKLIDVSKSIKIEITDKF